MSLSTLAPDGKLRVGFNLNNAALVQRTGAGFAGIAARLAQQICEAAGLQLQPIAFANAREMVETAVTGWDMAFLAVDPARCDRIAFSKPYHRVEATFMLRDTACERSCAEILLAGNTVISAQGAAYHSRLSALIHPEKLRVAVSPTEAHKRFLSGEADALAGIRETLDGLQTHQSRVLEDGFGSIDQAVGVGVHARHCLPFINTVLAASG